jgi:CPA2 family monovalent cation:H+ antiporter-2
MRADISPRPDILFGEGDVIVLLGSPEGLVAAEMYLLTGKAN